MNSAHRDHDTQTDTIRLGDVEVTRVVEWTGAIRTARDIIPDSSPATWHDHRDLLAPAFWDPDTDAFLCAIQSWVLRSEGRTIVVDTGAGNDRSRPQVPQFDHLSTPFLDNLARAGVRPEDVDVVVNTHIHYDHVGWNTRLEHGQWTPTFPNATYLLPSTDLDYFDPAHEHRRPTPRTEADRLRRRGSRLVYADSVTPVLEHGLVTPWSDTHRIDAQLTLEAAPGHTPGSSLLRLHSGTDHAVFVADMLHSPVQLHEPHANSCFCEDPQQARDTRRRVLTEAADTATVVFPAHFPGHGAAELKREGQGFAVTDWAGFSPLLPSHHRPVSRRSRPT